MAHDWKECPNPNAEKVESLLSGPYRKCANCGKVQERVTEYAWGRVSGYLWRPLAGRCETVKEIPRG